jgi:hypothetical protein
MTHNLYEVDVKIKVLESNLDSFTILLKEYGKRNLLFYNLGFDRLSTLDEILSFLHYKFNRDNGDLLIYEFCGDKFSLDKQMWRMVSKYIESGHFCLTNNAVKVISLKFEQGKCTSL